MKRPIYILLAALALLTGGCRKAPQWKVAEGAVWHTTYRILYDAPEALDDSIQAVLRHFVNEISVKFYFKNYSVCLSVIRRLGQLENKRSV